MLSFTTIDGRTLRVSGPGAAAGQVQGCASFRPTSPRRALSAETLSVSVAPVAALAAHEAANGVQRVGSEDRPGGTVVLGRLPGGRAGFEGGPAEPHVGAFWGPHHGAWSFFYRPLHRLGDAVAFFDAVDLRDGPAGLSLPPGRFAVVRQQYQARLAGGVLVVEAPRGVPRTSRRALAAGSAWVDRSGPVARVVFESDEVRLSFVPVPAPPGARGAGPGAHLGPGAVAEVEAAFAAITEASWS